MRWLLLSLLLSACVTTGGGLRGSGEVAPPPLGWDAHCNQIPKPDECKK